MIEGILSGKKKERERGGGEGEQKDAKKENQ
jgi:hypothetical protein